MKKYLFLLPFLYVPLFITWPIHAFGNTYAKSVLLLFWVPTLFMLAVNWKWISGNNYWRPFLKVNLYLGIASCYFEFACLGMDIWRFSRKEHPNEYIGFAPFGAPIEEFMFYFGAASFCLLLYFTFFRIAKMKEFPFQRKEEKSVDWPAYGQFAWMLVSMIFLPIMHLIHKQLKKERVISWPAVFMTTLIFWGAVAQMEAHSVHRGFWVYNKERVLTIIPSTYFHGVAVEEFFQYYVLAPIMVALFFHFLQMDPIVKFRASKLQEESEYSLESK